MVYMKPETTQDPNSIMAQLRARTAHQHQATENTVALMRPDYTLEDYRKLLTRFYSFYKSYEAKMHEAISENPIDLNYSERQNTPKLIADLKTLGFSDAEIEAIPAFVDLPQMNSAERIFGSLYVIEGSTLGGQVISRHLKGQFDLDETNGAMFFSGYGKETGKMWNAYREAVTNFAESNADKEEIIAGANETFEKIGKCLVSM